MDNQVKDHSQLLILNLGTLVHWIASNGLGKRIFFFDDTGMYREMSNELHSFHAAQSGHNGEYVYTNSVQAISCVSYQRFDVVIIPREDQALIKNLRFIAHRSGFRGTIIVVSYSPLVDQLWPRTPFENPNPILFYSMPCVGTNRLRFSLEFLVAKLGYKLFGYSPFLRNSKYIQGRGNRTLAELPDPTTDAVKWRLRTSEFFEFVHVHEPINLKDFTEGDLSTVVLIRDPRDVVTSLFYHIRAEMQELDDEEVLQLLINGYDRRTRLLEQDPLYLLHWPSIKEITEQFLHAVEHPERFIVVRYEELDDHDPTVLKRIMTSLGLYPHPLIELTESDFRHALHLGTFEYQTGGKRQRNSNATNRVGKEYDGSSSCRRGSSGDWIDLFPESIRNGIIDSIGDSLIKLGYH